MSLFAGIVLLTAIVSHLRARPPFSGTVALSIMYFLGGILAVASLIFMDSVADVLALKGQIAQGHASENEVDLRLETIDGLAFLPNALTRIFRRRH